MTLTVTIPSRRRRSTAPARDWYCLRRRIWARGAFSLPNRAGSLDPVVYW